METQRRIQGVGGKRRALQRIATQRREGHLYNRSAALLYVSVKGERDCICLHVCVREYMCESVCACTCVCVRVSVLNEGSTCCNKLQHTATHCNTLQRTATHCSTLRASVLNEGSTHCNISESYSKILAKERHVHTA